jgi:catechol 2,3-dioxygenase
LFMSAGGYHHHLGTNTWAKGVPPAQDDDARLLEWEIVVPELSDADRAAASVGRAGYDAVKEGNTWRIVDPWGTALRLVPQS